MRLQGKQTKSEFINRIIDEWKKQAEKVFRALAEAGIVKEITGKSRNRVFLYQEYTRIMNEGTEPR